jgi:hypothetical protein
MPTKSKPHKIKQYQQQQQQQQQSKMKIIQAAFILPAIFGIAAGRIGDAPTGVLQAPTIQAASFGSLQASAVAAPSGAIIDPSPVLNEDLDHMDLGALFAAAFPGDISEGKYATGSIALGDLFAAAFPGDSISEGKYEAVSGDSLDPSSAKARRTVCFLCSETEDPAGNITRVCLVCVGPREQSSAAVAGAGAPMPPSGP